MDICTGEEKKGAAWPRRRWIDNIREDMKKYELTADMTENRHYWKMMMENGPQLWHTVVEMVSKSTLKVRNVSKYSVCHIMTRMWL